MSSKGMPSASFGHRLAARGADVAAGAVDQDVHLAERRLDVRLHLRDRVGVADVAGDGGDLARRAAPIALGHLAEVGELAVFRRLRPVEVVDRDVGAELGQALGHHPAEAAARAGDEGGLAAEFPPSSFSYCMIPSARMLAALRRIMSSS